MAYFHDIIDDQVLLLKLKGFDRRTLNSFTPPGYCRDFLENNLAQCVLFQGHRPDIDRHIRFDLPLTGFFSEDKDITSYRLSYVYDRQNRTLSLDSVSGSMLSASVSLPIAGCLSKDTPLPLHIYYLLREELRQQSRHELTNTPHRGLSMDEQLQVHGIVRKQQGWLASRGYLSAPLLHHPDDFLDDLKIGLFKSLSCPPGQQRLFVVRSHAHLADWQDPVQMRFLFQTSTDASQLHLLAAEGSLAGVRHNAHQPLPPARVFLAALLSKQAIQKAQQLLSSNTATLRSKLSRHGI